MSAFNLQPTLTGSLISLRPLRTGDFDDLFVHASDPGVWEQHPFSNRYQRNVFREFFDGAMKSGGALAVIDLITGALIGTSRFYRLAIQENATGADSSDALAIGYTFLGRKFWGGRYNGEMKKLMTEHAFQTVKTVYFEIGEKNLRSRRAIEKIGARLSIGSPSTLASHVVYRLEAEAKTSAHRDQ